MQLQKYNVICMFIGHPLAPTFINYDSLCCTLRIQWHIAKSHYCGELCEYNTRQIQKLKSVTSEEYEVMTKHNPWYFKLGAVWKCNLSRISAKYCNSNTPKVIIHMLLTHMQQYLTSMLANKMNYSKFVQSLSNFEI